jgi:dinuclear metal center YbgI/SA1388 family protein
LLVKLAKLIALLNQIAPPWLALPSDPVGLQAGDPEHEVRKILLALDLSPDVLDLAVRERVHLIVCHHPLIFQPLHAVTAETTLGKKLYTLIKHRIDFFAMHTNFDIAPGGLNDALAEGLGLQATRPLKITHREDFYKLVVFVPASQEETVRRAMHDAGAGVIGAYTHCSFRTPGTGTFRPSEHARPSSGRVGELQEVEELRVEVLVPAPCRESVIAAMKKAHPYEEVAYDLYPLENEGQAFGLGRVGELAGPMTAEAVIETMRRALEMRPSDQIRVRGATQRKMQRVAVCSGSGGSLVPEVIRAGAELFITGEIKYHEELIAVESGTTVAAFGHDHTEKIFGKILRQRLEAELATQKESVEILVP